MMMTRRLQYPILALALLCLTGLACAEGRFMRYRILSPAVPTIATIGVQSHILSETSWQPLERPGVISNYGLYIPPNTWSPWRKLPDPPTWGTIQLNVKAPTPITAV